jgi:hypothetical protein
MLFSGAWRKTIHEKNLKQKSLDTVPLKRPDIVHRGSGDLFNSTRTSITKSVSV